jgi:hypothetical protein
MDRASATFAPRRTNLRGLVGRGIEHGIEIDWTWAIN